MLNIIKRELKELLANDQLGELILRLRVDVLDANVSRYNEAVSLEGRWNNVQSEEMKGTIDLKDKNQIKAQIRQALLLLIDGIKVADLSDEYKREGENHKAIPLQHIYTCDRFQQSDEFLLYYYDPPPETQAKHEGKLHFCYFYGDSKQEHRALFRRLGLEAGGFLSNWRDGDYDPGVKAEWVEIKPRVSRHPRIFRINILKEIFGQFCPNMHQQQPLMERKLSHLAESAALKSLGAEDFVFIFLNIDDHNWDKKMVPDIMRSLYEDFCGSELPEDSPQFFFFFGIEYQKTNTVVQQEVKATIPNTEFGMALPELEAVQMKDISEWLSAYDVIIPQGKDAVEMAKALFPEQETLDMTEVMLKLKEIVDQHNKGLIIKLE